ncbi:MAG: cell division ATPase MinD [Nanoarchaeota archaeon]
MATRYIGCISAKGGVGKTTTTINLAAALTYFGKNVTILDANLTTPNVGIYLGNPIAPITLHDVLRGKHDIKEAVFSHKSGLKAVLASISLKDAKKVDTTKLAKAIYGLEGTADIILVDGAAGLGKEPQSAIRSVEEVIIVTNPEMPAVTDALKTIKLCKEMGKNILGVVVTKTNSKNVDMSLKDIESLLETNIIGVIPEDRAVKFSQANKETVVHSHPKSAAAVQYKRLAADMLGLTYHENVETNNGFVNWVMTYLGFKD